MYTPDLGSGHASLAWKLAPFSRHWPGFKTGPVAQNGRFLPRHYNYNFDILWFDILSVSPHRLLLSSVHCTVYVIVLLAMVRVYTWFVFRYGPLPWQPVPHWFRQMSRNPLQQNIIQNYIFKDYNSLYVTTNVHWCHADPAASDLKIAMLALHWRKKNFLSVKNTF